MTDKTGVFNDHSEHILIRLYDKLFGNADELARIVRIAGSKPGSVIEAGCGTGRVIAAFAKHGWKVVGFDHDSRMLAIAQEKLDRLVSLGECDRGMVDLSLGDMTQNWPIQDADLAVVAYNTLLMCDGLEDIAATLRRAADALHADGRLIVSIIRISDGLEGVIYHHSCRETDDAMFVMRSAFRKVEGERRFVRSYYVDELRRNGEVRSFFTEWAAVATTAVDLTSLATSEGFRLAQGYEGYDDGVFEVGQVEPRQYLLEFRKNC